MKKLLSIILSITMLFSMGTVAFADGVFKRLYEIISIVGKNGLKIAKVKY